MYPPLSYRSHPLMTTCFSYSFPSSLLIAPLSFQFPGAVILEYPWQGREWFSAISTTDPSANPVGCAFRIYPKSNYFLSLSLLPPWLKPPSFSTWIVLALPLNCSLPVPALTPFGLFSTVSRMFLLQHKSDHALLCWKDSSGFLSLKVKA